MAELNPETDFELMFESAPISLWLEDYSALKVLFDSWRAQGVTDLLAHVAQTPALLQQCAACLKVVKVNRKTLAVFAASSQQELVQRLPEVFRDDTLGQMLSEMNFPVDRHAGVFQPDRELCAGWPPYGCAHPCAGIARP